MDQKSLDKLLLTNVHQTQIGTVIHLFFTMNDRNYRLLLVWTHEDVFKPYRIDHSTSKWCAFCQKKEIGAHCKPFDPFLNDLFHRLIEHPSIRLEWLYIPYEEKIEEE